MEVSDAVWEAAANIWRDFVARPGEIIAERALREGRMDDSNLIGTLARHRHQALSAQAAELDALRGEVERLNAIYHSPTGDNHHNAARCPYCRPEYEQDHATIAQLRDRVAALEDCMKRCAEIVDRNLYRQHEKIEDVPRLIRALITQNEVG